MRETGMLTLCDAALHFQDGYTGVVKDQNTQNMCDMIGILSFMFVLFFTVFQFAVPNTFKHTKSCLKQVMKTIYFHNQNIILLPMLDKCHQLGF